MSRSQRIIVRSLEPESKRSPSGEATTDMTTSLWPRKRLVSVAASEPSARRASPIRAAGGLIARPAPRGAPSAWRNSPSESLTFSVAGSGPRMTGGAAGWTITPRPVARSTRSIGAPGISSRFALVARTLSPRLSSTTASMAPRGLRAADGATSITLAKDRSIGTVLSLGPTRAFALPRPSIGPTTTSPLRDMIRGGLSLSC